MDKIEGERYQRLNTLMTGINEEVKKFVRQICEETVADPDKLYVKIEIKNLLYTISLYHADYAQTAEANWLLEDFFLLCQTPDSFEYDVNVKVRQMIDSLQRGESAIVN